MCIGLLNIETPILSDRKKSVFSTYRSGANSVSDRDASIDGI